LEKRKSVRILWYNKLLKNKNKVMNLVNVSILAPIVVGFVSVVSVVFSVAFVSYRNKVKNIVK